MVAKNDKIAIPSKVCEMYKAYGGRPKRLTYLEGEHNSIRSWQSVKKGAQFLLKIWATIEKYKQEENLNGIRQSHFEAAEGTPNKIRKTPKKMNKANFGLGNIQKTDFDENVNFDDDEIKERSNRRILDSVGSVEERMKQFSKVNIRIVKNS